MRTRGNQPTHSVDQTVSLEKVSASESKSATPSLARKACMPATPSLASQPCVSPNPSTCTRPLFNRVCVVGLGKLGLPWACILASKGITVVGIDAAPQVVQMVNRAAYSGFEPDVARL